MTLQSAIQRNRAREIRVLTQRAAKAQAKADRYRRHAQDVVRNAKQYLDPQGEIRFLLACAEPFDQEAQKAQARIAGLQVLVAAA